MTKLTLNGWGRTTPGISDVDSPKLNELDNIFHTNTTILPRGLGRTYGDAAQNSGGRTILLDQIRKSHLELGVLEVEAGESIGNLTKLYLGKGWFIPVTPGTKFVTIGGAIASDVHGKNHHCAGSFGDYIVSLDISTPIGDFTCSREIEPELFWATVGGMGLTGIIKRARINMRKVETSKMNVTTLKTSNLEETIQKFTKLDTFFDYSVAWIDTMADGNSLGRSIISFGNHASLQDLEAEDKKNRYDVSSLRSINLPKYIPNGLLNKRTSKLFNDIWYRKSPRKKENEIQTIERFFYPLDFVKEWNRIYGNEGFLQYQIVIPEKNMFLISEIIETFSKVKCPIFLTVLKKMGNSNLGILSFPLKGWTLAFDIPAGFQDLNQILDKLDERIIEFGGRVYLAKDSRINSRVLREMYPRIDEFMSIRRKYDPNLVIQSDLARRLYL